MCKHMKSFHQLLTQGWQQLHLEFFEAIELKQASFDRIRDFIFVVFLPLLPVLRGLLHEGESVHDHLL